MSEPILSFLADGLSAETAGGKGANLAVLSRAGFPVPPGFIISTQAYQDFVLENHIQPRILVLMHDLQTERPEAAERVSRAIYALFAQASIPEQLAQRITAAYQDLTGGGSAPVAVRSSANAEDLPGFAFAGQQDTFLNVVGEQALLAAVKDCWASLWTARAITYRERNGFAPESVALAVVVQAMVAAEVSGVLFSANPLTGKRREIHIDASFGLGEAIVSGQVEPDHYVVDPAANQINERRLGAKQVLIGSKAGGGTERIERGADGGEAQALPDAAILELAQIGQHVEAHFGEPQDIEWAWADGCFFLLQSRPITSLFPLPDETLAQAEPQIYFNFNAMQGVPGPLTPLGIAALRMVFTGALTTLGIQRPAEQVFRQAGGRLFLDFGDLPRDPTLQKMVLNFLSSIEPGERDILRQLIEDGRIPPRRVLSPRLALGMLRVFGPIMVSTLASLVRYQKALERVSQEADGFVEQVQASAAMKPDAAVSQLQR